MPTEAVLGLRADIDVKRFNPVALYAILAVRTPSCKHCVRSDARTLQDMYKAEFGVTNHAEMCGRSIPPFVRSNELRSPQLPALTAVQAGKYRPLSA